MPRSAQESSQRAQPHTQAVRKATVSQNLATVVNTHNSTSCKIDNHTILRQSEFPRMAQRPVDLLVGQARVWNVRLQEFEDVNMILDTGAEQSFITNDYADHLGLGISGQMNLMIHTFGTASPTEKTCNTTKVEIEDRHGTRHNFELARIDFITGDVKRTALPALDRQYLREHDIQLSISPQIREIQTPILLGCGDLFTLFDHGLGAQHHLPSGLQLLHSRIGYLVAGRNNSARKRSEVQLNTIRSRSVDDKAEQLQWDHYWNVDSAGIEEFTGPQTQELRAINEKVWEQFRTTVERHDDGYYVRLPWKDSANDLPDNRALAYNRLRNIHSKIKSQPDLLLQYHNTFREQLEKGVIEEVDETAKPDGKIVLYLAHHAVLTPHKDTTKLRIVFDGSAHYKNAPCLNDKLHQGAVILPSLTDMLLRFRAGNIAIISDVEKAFLQVHLQIQDRDATRCLWIRDISKPVKTDNIVTYRFTRVLFGLNCSPFLLGATIIEHLDHIDDREMADLIKNNVYVDNLLMTATTPDEALERLQKARQIFTEINMNLREFRTNSEEVNDRIPPDKLSKSIIPKVLGLQWNSAEDTITITCCYPDKTTITKRTVSEQISSIYDPFGWLTPLTLNAKLFQQNIWKFNYKWDEELSEAHQNEWKRILARSHGFTKSIIRKVSDGSKTSTARLVAFADASRQAMAACVYLINNGSQELLVAKSKLPSIKNNFTIPKLEMNALTLAARLVHNTLRALESQLCVKSITIYSDSEVALAWLASSDISNKAGVLVRNRCMEIRKINDDMIRKGIEVKFGHVNTDLNPANCATRGLWKEDLETHPWWNGPSFIASSYDQWLAASSLSDRKSFDEVGQVEMQRNILHTTAANQQDSVKEILNWKRYSSVNHAVSVFSYALRWLNRIISRVQPDLRDSILEHIPQLKKRHDDEFPTVPERRDALTLLIRNYQQVHVEKNIEPTKDRLIPFQDTNGLIRCRGRLRNSELSDECKQPILLTANTTFATLVIQDAHSKFHLGTAHTMAEVRTHYWIPQLRRQVQKVIRRCIPCQRMNNLPYRYPELPDLPSRRVVRSRPFQHVGIDYFGPITVKSNEESDKAYGCNFSMLSAASLLEEEFRKRLRPTTHHILF
ncbi:hypothetical protein Q1695_006637 [Nippostrongylus brasiliensis]|nr:hypothetical protein Q1695_006637 [Nippostrongylus brasiliensis]